MTKAGYSDELDGRVRGAGRRVALVVSRFNGHVTDQLLEGARACLLEHGVDEAAVEVVRVPGAWELPLAVRVAARTRRFDAVVALGCVIRGETPHFDYICAEAARGLGAAARATGVPVSFGVLTTDTEEQALQRADPHGGNKGREAALSALEMAEVLESLSDSTDGPS